MNKLAPLLLLLPLLASAATITAWAPADCRTAGPLPSHAREEAEAALKHAQDQLPPTDPGLAEKLAAVARVNYSLRLGFNANQYADRALAIWSNATPDAALAAQLRQAGHLYMQQNNCTAAEPVLRLALSVGDQTQTHDIAVLQDLAQLYQIRNDSRNDGKAEAVYQRLMREWEQSGVAVDADMAEVYGQLANIYFYQRREADAERLLLRAVAIHEQAGGNQRLLAARLADLAAVDYAQLRTSEGDAQLARADAILKPLSVQRPWNSPMPTTLIFRSTEDIKARYQHGDVQGAMAAGAAALETLEQTLAADAGKLDEIKARLAQQQALQAPAADRYYQERELKPAIASAERKVRAGRIDVAIMTGQLGELQHSQRQYAAAEAQYLKALDGFQNSNAGKSLQAARTLGDLGLLYRSQGNYAAALERQQQALDIFLPKLGADHPDTIESQSQLVWLGGRK